MRRSVNIRLAAAIAVAVVVFAGCGGSGGNVSGSSAAASSAAGSASGSAAASSTAASRAATATPKLELADGTYEAKFTTDSSMFHVNEAYDNKGTLTVKDGQGIIHITLASKNVTNLFFGTADDAKKDGAKLIEPTTDKVKYKDGSEDEAYGFDVPVPVIDKEFDCALLGSKGKWYDHKVKVSDAVKK